MCQYNDFLIPLSINIS